MTAFHRFIAPSAALLCIAATSFGAPEPVEPAPAPTVKSGEVKNTAYLGVVTSLPPQIISDQLGLDHGEGLIIQAVAPDGPAAKAGLETNDIIVRVNDAPIRSAMEFTRLIRSQKPGDTIKLNLIRKGAPTEVTAILGSRAKNQMHDERIAKVIRDWLEKNPNWMDGNADPATTKLAQSLIDGNPAMGAAATSSATLRMIDNDGCIELKSADSKREVTVRDKENKIIWSGPWNSDDEKSAAPAEIRKRIGDANIESLLDESGGLRLKSFKPKSDKSPQDPAK